MSRRRWCLAAALGLCFLGIPAIFRGAVTDVLMQPEPPILVGFGTNYLVVADDPTGEYMWRWRCPGDPPDVPPGDWSPEWFQSDPWYFIYNDHVGTFDDNFWAEEDPDIDDEDPPVWNEKTIQTSVLGPNTDDVPFGLNVNSDGDLLTIYFRPLHGDDPIGGEIAGYAEEQLQFKKPWEGADKWSAPTPWIGHTEDYFWDEGSAMIEDSKAHDTNSANFQALNVGDAFQDIFQRNRLVIKNCEGLDQEFILPNHYFQAIKTGANTYKYVEHEIP